MKTLLILVSGLMLWPALQPLPAQTTGNSTNKSITTDKLLVKARAFKARQQWEEAEIAYDAVVHQNKTNFDIYIEYKQFLSERWYDPSIIRISYELLPGYRKLTTNGAVAKRNVAVILQYIGNAGLKQGHFDEAGKNLLEADKILNELTNEKPGLYSTDVARVQKRLGYYYTETGDFKQAAIWLDKALNTISQHVSDPVIARYETADGHLFFSHLYEQQRDVELAQKEYEKVIGLIDTGTAEVAGINAENIAFAQKGLAKILLQEKDSSGVVRLYEQVVEFYEKKAVSAPEKYVEKVQDALTELVNTFNTVEKITANFKWVEKVLAYNLRYYQVFKLEAERPEFMGTAQLNYGRACMLVKNYTQADSSFQQALFYFQKGNPLREDHLMSLALARYNLANVNDSLKNYAKAEAYRLAILDLCKVLNDDSTALDPDICITTQSDLIFQYANMWTAFKTDSVFLKLQQRTTTLYAFMKQRCTAKQTNYFDEPCSPEICGALSHCLLLLKKFADAEDIARTGLKRERVQYFLEHKVADITTLSIRAALAHALLFQDKYADAEKIYNELKLVKPTADYNVVLKMQQDLDQYQSVGITNEQVKKIRKLLSEIES